MPTSQEAVTPAKDTRLARAVEYAEGALDRTALSIGLRTTADEERSFRHTIQMAMGAIRHELPAELTEAQVRQCGEQGLLAIALPKDLSPLTVQAYAEKVAATAVRAALALREGNLKS